MMNRRKKLREPFGAHERIAWAVRAQTARREPPRLQWAAPIRDSENSASYGGSPLYFPAVFLFTI